MRLALIIIGVIFFCGLVGLFLLRKVFVSPEKRQLKMIQEQLGLVREMESTVSAFKDTELRRFVNEGKKQLADGVNIDDLVVNTCAVVNEVVKRKLGTEFSDSQLIAALAMNERRLVDYQSIKHHAILPIIPATFHAMKGQAVHIGTVSDYLAQRYAKQTRSLFNALGLSVAVFDTGMSIQERQAAYQADITYGSISEFAFDYLRDNMAVDLNCVVQRGNQCLIINQAYCVLLDEARTPLIIVGPVHSNIEILSDIYRVISNLDLQKSLDAPISGTVMLHEIIGDYTMDEEDQLVELTDEGRQKIKSQLIKQGIFTSQDNINDVVDLSEDKLIENALRAYVLYKKGVHYEVKKGEVVLLDEFTHKLLEGRRFDGGLHQAIEAKEEVEIQTEMQTLASITVKNYLKNYSHIAGMTECVANDRDELKEIYNLDVLDVPQNRLTARYDMDDLIYLNQQSMCKAIVQDVKTRHEKNSLSSLGPFQL